MKQAGAVGSPDEVTQVGASGCVHAAAIRGRVTTERGMNAPLIIVVAAAGNHGRVGATIITSHARVTPVAACNLRGEPLAESNLGHSIGWRGLRAPGEHITSLGAGGPPLTLDGTSAAAPFVTGALALRWSLFPLASAGALRAAVLGTHGRRRMVTPPLLDAFAAYELLKSDAFAR